MKIIIGLGLSLLLFSCGETKKEHVVAEEIRTNAQQHTELEDFDDSPIPVYDFPKLEKELLQLRNDTTYIVNFWATWCKPCIKELPYFEELAHKYSDEKVKVVLVSLDFPENLHTKVVPFIEKYKLQSEVILLADDDANTWIPKVDTKWEGSIPATIIYNNKTRSFYERSFTYDELENELKSII